MSVQSPGPPAARPGAPKEGMGPLAWIGYGVIMFIAWTCRAAAPATTAARAERTRPRTEDLLRLTSARKEKLENALEKDWSAHVLVAGIGIAMVFNVGKVAESVIANLLKGQFDFKTVATILLAIHVFYFMRLGPLLTAFVAAKERYAKALEDCSTDGTKAEADAAKADPLDPLYGTTSFLAAALYPRSEGYLIFATLVVSVAQAASLFLVFKAYDVSLTTISPASIFFILVVALIVWCYFLFWQTRFTRATALLFTWASFLFLLFQIVDDILSLTEPR